MLEQWRRYYNTARPHNGSATGRRAPAVVQWAAAPDSWGRAAGHRTPGIEHIVALTFATGSIFGGRSKIGTITPP